MTRAEAFAIGTTTINGTIPVPPGLRINELSEGWVSLRDLKKIDKTEEVFKPSCSDGECGVTKHDDPN